MKKICAWCKKKLHGEGDGEQLKPITHGICPDCVREILSFKAVPMARYLDRFPGPVYLMNDNCEVISANQEGAVRLGKKIGAFVGRLAGEAFECEYSYLDGGCGKTLHCRTCTIRLSVLDTLKTGRSHRRVPAYPDLHQITGENDFRHFITTEKAGEAILVKVEEYIEAEE